MKVFGISRGKYNLTKTNGFYKKSLFPSLNALNITYIKTLLPKQIEAGFSLIEATTALVIISVTFGFALPIFISQRVQNINSEIRTGAIAISQQILDAMRTENLSQLHSAGFYPINSQLSSQGAVGSSVLQVTSTEGLVVGQSIAIGSYPNSYVIRSVDSTLNQITLTSPLMAAQSANAQIKPISLGYLYDVTIGYCTNTNLPCGTNSRNLLIQVKYNAQTVYTVETVYTQFN